MSKKMMVTGLFYDRDTGLPHNTISPIMQGTSKKSGKFYSIVEHDKRETIDGEYPVGTVICATTTYAVQDGAGDRNMKLNNKG